MNHHRDTIIALATAPGTGAISLIRLSGMDVFEIVQKVFKGKHLSACDSHTIHYGHIVNGAEIIDEVMVAIFKAPKSFTTENSVEISCHGSNYIAQQIIQLLVSKGARLANPGEFTLRAFLNGRIDLSQAEAVADLIASNSKLAKDIALHQMRGGFSSDLQGLRTELLNFASLIELEIDFSEEDVEFANRPQLLALLAQIQHALQPLIDSFAFGNVIKEGVPVAIVGKPNSGKSTLLNTLLNEERAIVSDIAGTTRDTIEEALNIHGIHFRIIDTAGLRETDDQIEQIGVKRALEKMDEAMIIVYLYDNTKFIQAEIDEIRNQFSSKKILFIANKTDIDSTIHLPNAISLSALKKEGIESLKQALYSIAVQDQQSEQNTIITNARHYDALLKSKEAIAKVEQGIIHHLSQELVSIDIKTALYHLGEITGEITNDEILGNIFGKFCIGK